MNCKPFLAVIIILFFTAPAFAQEDYCFKSKPAKFTDIVSFTLQGNKIISGEWDHGSSEGTTSSEIYSFTGRRMGNKLQITFSSVVPYAMPGGGKKGEWIFSKKALTVPMKVKNRIVKKEEVTNVVLPKCAEI